MASEIRVDKINSLSGVGTVTLSPTGVDIAGITTAATLRATTGIVTSLTAGSLTSLGAVSGTTGTFSGAVSGTTGTFTGDVDIADKIVHTGDTDTAIRFSGADTITAETGGSERFRIDSSGHVGINETNPDSNLSITDSENTTYDASQASHQRDAGATLRIQNNSTTTDSFAQLLLRNQSSNTGGCRIVSINKGNNASDLAITTGDTSEALRIDSSGRLLLGTTTEGHSAADDLTIATSSSTGVTIRSGTSNEGNIYFSDGTSGSGEYAGAISYNHSGNSLNFYANSTNRANIDSSGNLTVSAGNLVIGTDGKGIDFSSNTENESGAGSSSGQLLDDYEEGTWTPVFDAPDQSSTTFVHHRQHGYYTKIGNLVHVTCYIQGYADANTAGGSNDGIVIEGLPFTIADLPGGGNTRHAASFAVGSTYRLLVDDLIIHAYGAQTVAKLWIPSNGNTMSQLKSNQMTARGGTNEVYFAGSFRVHA